MNISRPTMISVLKENTRELTHMNRKQMWKIIEEKGLTDKAFELEKGVKRKVGSGRIATKKPVRAVDLDSLKETSFPSIEEAAEYFGKPKTFFVFKGRVFKNHFIRRV